ncbi:hypothetical protein VNO77_43647 [Canavalia gladiata]|uniref:Uncharacterized protein n=1 Tax=Canavalia gladiata TaxID=3824 RepID=A0AAN9JXH7_CANGL
MQTKTFCCDGAFAVRWKELLCLVAPLCACNTLTSPSSSMCLLAMMDGLMAGYVKREQRHIIHGCSNLVYPRYHTTLTITPVVLLRKALHQSHNPYNSTGLDDALSSNPKIGPEMILQLAKGSMDEEGIESDEDAEEQEEDPCTLAIAT